MSEEKKPEIDPLQKAIADAIKAEGMVVYEDQNRSRNSFVINYQEFIDGEWRNMKTAEWIID